MRLVEHGESREESFSEGEPELEPPEELALGELDEEHQLEEELDNEDVSEEEVDEETLELTLEYLVLHDHIEDGGESAKPDGSFPAGSSERNGPSRDIPATNFVSGTRSLAELEDLDVLDVLDVPDLEDYAEGLDRLLADRLAGDSDATDEPDEEDDPEWEPQTAGGGSGARSLQIRLAVEGLESNALPCRDDEFVCCSCFLVKKRAQLADAASVVCRDCTP